ncbi:MAG: hypothetical protein JWN98_1639 [Abditibacteriota bacterium]|nr:hypothetical protein [Abditibacteriota bacterium]
MIEHMKKLLVGCGLLMLTVPVRAQGLSQSFEAVGNDHFLPVGGKDSKGSTIEISTERAHQGQKSAKVNYKFSGSGFLELHSARPRDLVTTGDKLHLSLWVYGAAQNHYANIALRLLDAEGEVFQYSLPATTATAFNGTGWREVRAEIDLTKPTLSWGTKKNDLRELPMKFLGFGVTRAGNEAATGTFFLDDLRLSHQPLSASGAATQIATAAPRLTLEPEPVGAGPKLYFFAPGTVKVRMAIDHLPAALLAANTAAAAPPVVRWRARDFGGRTIAQGQLAPRAARATTLSVAATRPGIVYLSATLLGAGEENLAEAETRFAILRPRPIAPAMNAATLPILYGACAHLSGKSVADAEREVALMAALGFRACRFDYTWGNIQPERDVWKWETFDRIFGWMEKYRIVPLPIISYTTRWATTGDPNAEDWHQWHNAPPITADYARFARESARRYGRIAKHWEIWNEPDIAFWLGTAEQYATMWDAAKTAIDEVQPEALVMNGGFSEVKRRPDFIPTWQKTSKQKPDIFAYHSHMVFANMVRAAADVKGYLTGANWKMPVWLNEAGFSSVGALSERDQAIALVKKMSAAPELGFSGYFWYDIRNDGTDRSENEHNFGLVRHDFTPKAAAVAAHTLQEALEGQRFVRRLPVPGLPEAYALLFERPNARQSTLVLWNEADATVPLFWRAPAGATRISMMGERSVLSASNGLVALPMMPEPQFLQFSGAARQLAVTGRLLEFQAPVMAGPGDTVPFRITLRNPLNQALRGTIALNPTGAWKVQQPMLSFDVPANGSREYRSLVTAPTALAGVQELQLAVTSPSLPSGATARVPLQTAVVVPRRANAGILGDFAKWTTPVATLGRANVVSLFEATPMQELLFRGDDDLSAQIHLARVPQGLLLAVRVRDNAMNQNEEAGAEWKGDSLQWSLALPSGEHYEWVAALGKDGPVARLTIAPPGVPNGALQLPLTVSREGQETLYEVLVPAALPGGKALPDTFNFSALVNDNDGGGRKGWIEWTPGIGRTKNPQLFQPLAIR